MSGLHPAATESICVFHDPLVEEHARWLDGIAAGGESAADRLRLRALADLGCSVGDVGDRDALARIHASKVRSVVAHELGHIRFACSSHRDEEACAQLAGIAWGDDSAVLVAFADLVAKSATQFDAGASRAYEMLALAEESSEAGSRDADLALDPDRLDASQLRELARRALGLPDDRTARRDIVGAR